ncbi:MAG: hypothetical protein KF870_07320 [Leadbetterella sp.]|nr:hypothetical protein [Leadbetterella sp.]
MPVPLTNYDDLDIRAGVIEGGGSVPSAFSWEDLVNAADWNKFHPSYLDGATSKTGIVHEGQFRGYPYSAPCPDPIFSPSFYQLSGGYYYYVFTITNAGGRAYNISFTVQSGTAANVVTDDGTGVNVRVRTNAFSGNFVNIYFEDNGTCPDSNTVSKELKS